MTLSLLFALIYFLSLYYWIKAYAKGAFAWTWWIILFPIIIIITVVIFFITWIGWIMIKPKPKSIEEFIKEQDRKIKDKEAKLTAQ